MASAEMKVTIVVTPTELVMDEAQFKKYLIDLIREAVSKEDAILINPSSYQALVLKDGDGND